MKLALFDCIIIPFCVCQLHEITFKNSHVVTVNNLNDLKFFFVGGVGVGRGAVQRGT